MSSFSSPCMLHLLLPVPEILPTAAAFSPILHHHQTMTGSWRWRALSPYATAVSQRQTLAACVTLQAPFTACSLRHDHNPIAVCLLRESPCFAGLPPEHEHCSRKKIPVNDCYAAEHFLFFVALPKLFNEATQRGRGDRGRFLRTRQKSLFIPGCVQGIELICLSVCVCNIRGFLLIARAVRGRFPQARYLWKRASMG